jgi:hypothetical protein
MNKLLVTPQVLAAVNAFDKKGEEFAKATTALCAMWIDQGVTLEHFTRPTGDKRKDNLHVSAYAFLAELGLRTITFQKKKANAETVQKFLDPEVASAALLQGLPKGGAHEGGSWNSQVTSRLGKWRNVLKAHIAAQTAPTTGTPKRNVPMEEALLKVLQTWYTKTQKEGFTCADEDGFKKSLHLAAFAFTGKEGQIKTGDKTKK